MSIVEATKKLFFRFIIMNNVIIKLFKPIRFGIFVKLG